MAGVMDTTQSARNGRLLLAVDVACLAIGIYILDAVSDPWRLVAVHAFIIASLLLFLLLAWRNFSEDSGARNQSAALD